MISKPPNNKTILIADDSREHLNMLGKCLKAEGFTVLAAIDGKQAFGIVQNKHPHLILIEAGISGMDGFDVCRSVKKHNSVLGTSVIMMTEQADPAVIEKAFAAGADDFISKPYDRDELVTRIHSVLKQKKKPKTSDIKKEGSSTKKVLLVEDNELNQSYIEAIVGDLGFTIDIANNGGTALENFLTKKYDLILTDINVPVINGIELSKIIRSKYSKDIPIIAISGHSEKELADKCLAAGMNTFVTKPFTSRELKLVITRLFSQESGDDGEHPPLDTSYIEEGLKKYNYNHALEMAKGDDELLRKWIKRFKEVVNNGVESVNTSIGNNEYPDRNKTFHELINYSGYFGLDELRSYIQELNSIQQFSSDKERIGNFYRKIKSELQNVQAYYEEIG